LANPKSSTFTGAVLTDHHVGGLEVAMDDAVCVSDRQRVGDRNRNPNDLAGPHAVPQDEGVQAFATHELITMKSRPSADSIS